MRIGCNVDTSRDERDLERRSVAEIIDEIITEGILAERAGFHSVRVPDRHGRPECFFPGSLQLLTLLAQETHRVVLGAFALANPQYHPMLIAEECAIIDNLSRGRLFMTWALGAGPWGYFGIPSERLLGRFLENLRVIELAYAGEPFSFHGQFYDVDEALLTPRPYQHPRFPFWGGGKSSPAIERSASFAEAWACDDIPFDLVRWRREATAYRGRANDHSKVPFIVLSRNAWVAESDEAAWREFGDAYVEHLKSLSARGRLSHVPSLNSPEKISRNTAREHLIIGSADQCLEQIQRYQDDLEIDYLTMRFRIPNGPEGNAVQDQIVRFGEEIVAPLHRNGAATIHPAIPQAGRW